ncbi:MAG: T9SS type A sorting domain-containing protein [Flavobacteriales bacterium]|nr:T9SS type A sorting domain-containing protein [Flavobacteriales bacterium]
MITNKQNAFKIFSTWIIASILFISSTSEVIAQQSVARQWNDVMLEAIRHDFARPTVHSRNLFHVSVAMFDAWAAYDDIATPYLLGDSIGGLQCPFTGVPVPSYLDSARDEAVSFAAYRVLRHRFESSPGADEMIPEFDTLMTILGYDTSITSVNYASGNPAELGNYIAQSIIAMGLQDGSNEQNDYDNKFYVAFNDPLIPNEPGNPDITNANRWQPLALDTYIDQSGNVIPNNVPDFLGPEWGQVVPFSLHDSIRNVYTSFGDEYVVYHDPSSPPYLDTNNASSLIEEYQWGFSLVSVWSSHLDSANGVMWDISPASIGNVQNYPTNIPDLQNFYNLTEGGDPGTGYTENPSTGLPYDAQMVPRADYARVLAEFWADGPDSETPPGHWFTLLNYVNDHAEFEKKWRGTGAVLDDLEWDVKAYFTLGGTVHDAAVTAWGIKGWYDYIRPVSAIRHMADLGQSSDSLDVNYNKAGIILVSDYIELVVLTDTLLGFAKSDTGKIKVKAWRGPDYISDPDTDVAGVGWILAENWWPYQRPTFVTPPFAGYTSGHSTFSRAAAEVMTALTGDAYFPGGMGEFLAEKDSFLVFEDGPSMDITLQWATYRDASDQCSLSRIWGGIHPPVDDMPGRLIGEKIGVRAFDFAEKHMIANPFTFANNQLETSSNGTQIIVYPNPLKQNSVATLSIELTEPASVQVDVFNTLGSKVASPFVQSNLSASSHTISINSKNLSAGSYVIRTLVDGIAITKQLVIK